MADVNASLCSPVELIVILVILLTVNLWTMFQAAQKLGGYEVVSVYTICLKSSAVGSTLFPLALKDS